MIKKYVLASLALSISCSANLALADLAQDAQNPVANLVSVPLQNNFNFEYGPFEKMQYDLNIEPVIPISINKDWNLITRTIIPIINEPVPTNADEKQAGLGDINPTLFLSPANSGEFDWGIGPTAQFPTATNKLLGTGKYEIGPAVALIFMPAKWVLGILTYNLTSIGGQSSRSNVNEMTIQYFATLNLPKQWFISSSPINTADWEAKRSNRWTVPIGGGFGRIIKFGTQPVNASIQAFYNVVRPQFAAKWSIRATAALLFPS